MRRSAFWIAFILATAAVSVRAETFFLKDGGFLSGTVLRSVGNTLSIKLDNGGMHQLPVGMVDQVEMTAGDGTRIVGRLSRWDDGVFLLVTDQGLIEVKDGVVIKVADSQTPTVEAEPVEPDLGEGVVAPAPAARSLSEGRQEEKLEPTM